MYIYCFIYGWQSSSYILFQIDYDLRIDIVEASNQLHYSHCITLKRKTSLLGLSPRHCTRATSLLSKKATSHWQRCV